MEFRESTARQCVEQAYRRLGQDAVKFVRRAVELCGNTNFTVQASSQVAAPAPHLEALLTYGKFGVNSYQSGCTLQGLSRSCIQYVQTHPSESLFCAVHTDHNLHSPA